MVAAGLHRFRHSGFCVLYKRYYITNANREKVFFLEKMKKISILSHFEHSPLGEPTLWRKKTGANAPVFYTVIPAGMTTHLSSHIKLITIPGDGLTADIATDIFETLL